MSLLDSIKIALSTQEEIKSQLLSEIKNLEINLPQNPNTNSSQKFLQFSFRNAELEKKKFLEELSKYNNIDFPKLNQRLQRITQKCSNAEFRIGILEKSRVSNVLNALETSNFRNELLKEFSVSINEEIDQLKIQEIEYSNKIKQAKEELRILQNSDITKLRLASSSNWDTELKDEKHFNIQLLASIRKRSNTISSRPASSKNLPFKILLSKELP